MSSTIHPSRLPLLPKPKPKPTKRKPPKPQPASTSLPTSHLRKKTRDLSRLLSKTSLPATTRLDHERALKSYTIELSHRRHLTQTSTLQKRYHKIKFFERRKATRLLSRLNRLQNPTDDEKRQIHEAEVDLNYILHYPATEKYISLYKSGDNADTNAKRQSIKLTIEKRMADGTLSRGAELVEYNAAEGFGPGATKGKKKKAPEKPKQENDDDEGSDGGFFEL
ncbi:18S rRNA maturation protein [Arthrobotrys musiformis]|uniref:rRNA-processing protein EFG1 n=1 Tax=Arthrobotrys musiformis TaxID=47236 RepID=A0AAV9WPZ7_9PEZI